MTEKALAAAVLIIAAAVDVTKAHPRDRKQILIIDLYMLGIALLVLSLAL